MCSLAGCETASGIRNLWPMAPIWNWVIVIAIAPLSNFTVPSVESDHPLFLCCKKHVYTPIFPHLEVS
jgi:hypothetical protein